MTEKRIYNLILDPVFQRLEVPLSPEEKVKFRSSFTDNGSKPLLVWQKILLTGYREYEIYHDLKIPFTINEIHKSSRHEVLIHICQLHLNETKGTDEHYRYRVGKLYEAMKEALLEKGPHQNQYSPTEQSRSQNGIRNLTADLLAGKVNVHPGTVYKYGRYAAAIDQIAAKCPEIADDILRAIFHLSQDDTVSLAKMSAPEIRVIRDHVVNKRDTRLLQSSIMRTREQEKKKAKLLAEERKNTPEIKLMPKYDPDAGLSSLTLTIPMWISSINRAIDITDFSTASTAAMWKLEQTLFDLSKSIETIREKIEERYHE